MKRKLFLYLIVLVSMQMQGQSISKQVIGSSGESITNGTHTLNFTVGEPIVGLIQNGEAIHQGFWGALFEDGTLSVTTPIEDVNQISVFPNPVVDYIQINYKQEEASKYTTRLFDINGRQVFNLNKNTQNQTTQIDMKNLANGMYLLTISDKSSNYNKSFKIIKK